MLGLCHTGPEPTWATSGPKWTRYQRTTLANSGQSSSQAIAAVRPVPQVMPQPRFSLARRKSPEPGPRWVRAATVAHGQQRSPTVANGSDEPQVIVPPAQAAGMMHAGDRIVVPKVGVGVPSVTPAPFPQLKGHTAPGGAWQPDHAWLQFCEKFPITTLKTNSVTGKAVRAYRAQQRAPRPAPRRFSFVK